jgi:hypothetical protein
LKSKVTHIDDNPDIFLGGDISVKYIIYEISLITNEINEITEIV